MKLFDDEPYMLRSEQRRIVDFSTTVYSQAHSSCSIAAATVFTVRYIPACGRHNQELGPNKLIGVIFLPCDASFFVKIMHTTTTTTTCTNSAPIKGPPEFPRSKRRRKDRRYRSGTPRREPIRTASLNGVDNPDTDESVIAFPDVLDQYLRRVDVSKPSGDLSSVGGREVQEEGAVSSVFFDLANAKEISYRIGHPNGGGGTLRFRQDILACGKVRLRYFTPRFFGTLCLCVETSLTTTSRTSHSMISFVHFFGRLTEAHWRNHLGNFVSATAVSTKCQQHNFLGTRS
jgi:hypothetical protein